MEYIWKTSRGAAYTFKICSENDNCTDVGGIYIFAGRTPQNVWSPKYIGQTNSFKTRFSQHGQLALAGFLGATHIHAMSIGNEAQRLIIEEALIRTHNPPLNKQHSVPGLFAQGLLKRPTF